MAPEGVAGVVLAAGKGTRMKSNLPKVLHAVCGIPMVEHVLQALADLGVLQPILVVGHQAEQVQTHLANAHVRYALQHEQKGTGHAVQQALPLLTDDVEHVLVLSGDTPLLTEKSLNAMLTSHVDSSAAITVASFHAPDPTGYGRIVRSKSGEFVSIVEQKDADPDTLAIQEVNGGLYCFQASALRRFLPELRPDNEQGELYLTDLIKMARDANQRVEAFTFSDGIELAGVNDRWQLAECAAVMRKRILRRHAESGVTIVDPASTYIDGRAALGRDVTVQPMTVIDGVTRVGERTEIGPNTRLIDCEVGSDCLIHMSHIARSKIGDRVRCGPFANLRPGTEIASDVKIGNFVEVKNSHLETGVSVSHLTYLGDADVGAYTNVGAGTITCNWDGFVKSRTTIGAGVFVGSNSTLVAPVNLGDGSFTAAGSVVTNDVPPDALAVGRSRQTNKEQWVNSWRQKRTKTDDGTQT